MSGVRRHIVARHTLTPLTKRICSSPAETGQTFVNCIVSYTKNTSRGVTTIMTNTVVSTRL